MQNWILYMYDFVEMGYCTLMVYTKDRIRIQWNRIFSVTISKEDCDYH